MTTVEPCGLEIYPQTLLVLTNDKPEKVDALNYKAS